MYSVSGFSLLKLHLETVGFVFDVRAVIIAGLCYSSHCHRKCTFEKGNSFFHVEQKRILYFFSFVDNFRSCLVQMSASSPSISLIFCFLVLFCFVLCLVSSRPFLCSVSYWNGFVLGRREVSFSSTASFNFGKNNPNQWPRYCLSDLARRITFFCVREKCPTLFRRVRKIAKSDR